jgi:UDP-galactose transporter B1
MIIISTTRFLRNQIWELRMKKRYEALMAWLYKDNGKFPTEIKLTFLVISLYGTFITWGYLQEKLTSTRYVNIDQEVVQWKFPLVLNLFVNLSAATTALFAPYLFYNQNKSDAEKEMEKEKKQLMLNQLQQRHNQQQQQNPSSTSPIAATTTTTSKKKKIKPEAPFYCYWKPALSATVATALSYISLAYISYPLMILSKSCKHVPVMFIGRFFYRKKYHWSKYVSVFFICLGILLFTALKTTTSKPPEVNTSSGSDIKNEFAMSLTLVVGLVFVFIHLILDGVTSNEQDSLFTNYSITSFQMMQNINLWQIIYSISYLGFEFFSHYLTEPDVSATRLYRASNMLLKTPACVMDICVFCGCACVGQLLIFDLIREFGSLIWITVSVTRQLFTILLSVFLFHHSLSSPQWIGIIFVFSGLGFEIVMNYVQKQQAATAAAAAASATPTATPRNETTPRHESPRRPQTQQPSLSPQHAKRLAPENRSQSRGPGGGSLSARSPRRPESAQGGLPPLPLAGSNVRKSATPPYGGTPRIEDHHNMNSARGGGGGRPVSRDAGRGGGGGSNYNSPRVMDWNSPPGQQQQTSSRNSTTSHSHNNNNFSSISSSSSSAQKKSNMPLLALHSLKKQQQAYPFDQSSSPANSARTTELDLTPVNSGRRSAGSSSSSYNNTPRKHDSRNNSSSNLRKLSGMSPPPPSTDDGNTTPRSGAESLKETILSNY